MLPRWYPPAGWALGRGRAAAAAARFEDGDDDLTFFGTAAKRYASDVAMEVTTDARLIPP